MFEFGEFTSIIKSLESAIFFNTEINHPVAGILIDLMHINRSNRKKLPHPDLNHDPLFFSYIQGCDFYQSSFAKLHSAIDNYIMSLQLDDQMLSN